MSIGRRIQLVTALVGGASVFLAVVRPWAGGEGFGRIEMAALLSAPFVIYFFGVRIPWVSTVCGVLLIMLSLWGFISFFTTHPATAGIRLLYIIGMSYLAVFICIAVQLGWELRSRHREVEGGFRGVN